MVKYIDTMVLNYKLSTVNQLLRNARRFHCSRIKGGYEGSGKSTIRFVNIDGPTMFVSRCTSMGFMLNNRSMVVGPLAIFPKTILSWNIASGKDINDESLSLFTALEPTLDILVLGLETKYDFKTLNAIKRMLLAKDIKTEILPVDQACGVYNFLCEEGRHVAAGLIPPLPEETHLYKKLSANMKALRKEKQIESE